MIIRNGNFTEFFEHVRHKNIYIYGAGRNAQEFYDTYENDLNRLNVCAIIDNDDSKQNSETILNGRKLKVISEKEFIQLDLDVNNTTILITMGDFWEVLSSLESIPAFYKLSCYIYSLLKLEDSSKNLYEEMIPPGELKSSGDFVIPPVIHYCWFGYSEIPLMAKKCIESWKKFCPGFEIRFWNEKNYDIEKNSYMLAAYKDKKWAFVSDYVRVDVVNKYGGVYLDTDVEILRPIDMLLREKAYAGFEDASHVAFGLGFGSIANNPILDDLLKLYDNLHWDGGQTACPIFQSEVLVKHGLIRKNSFQRLDNMTILPVRYLSPMYFLSGRKNYFSESFSIHHYAGTWVNDNVKRWNKLKQIANYGCW
ncbi:glycosyltransferase family 32 protein [Selenomonas ruminantium]|uniref:Capsular polysaccharide synthesis protein n=1 Tax=Selenomonas ruminantium TaxID=971 RepID=A0A1K1N9Z9_SELRU|nr:glycosyltransferase [Selenomonas ruminantium]SFW32113.1 Capsular polysaccharide synthesis protein [Selenomonas ruminantium]